MKSEEDCAHISLKRWRDRQWREESSAGGKIDFFVGSLYSLCVCVSRVLERFFVFLPAVIMSAGVALAAPNDSLTVSRDIPYDHVTGVDPNLLSLDVYAPKEGTAAARDLRPVLVMIHGGAWQIGDKATPNIGSRKAATFVSNGFVYVAINYRLSPSVRYATQAGDVAKALAWVVQNIGHYSGDPRRIYIMGHSAGAHLAALVATDETYLTGDGLSLNTISGVVLLDTGAYDIPWVMEHIATRIRDMMFSPAFGNDPKAWSNASPIDHISAGKGIPPMLILYANRPRSPDASRRFAQALKAAGVPAAGVEVQGKNHREMNRDAGNPNDAETQIILKFLRGKSLSELPESI
jgi:arylformamidase